MEGPSNRPKAEELGLGKGKVKAVELEELVEESSVNSESDEEEIYQKDQEGGLSSNVVGESVEQQNRIRTLRRSRFTNLNDDGVDGSKVGSNPFQGNEDEENVVIEDDKQSIASVTMNNSKKISWKFWIILSSILIISLIVVGYFGFSYLTKKENKTVKKNNNIK